MRSTYTQAHKHTLKAIIANSGNANAVTGKKGLQNAALTPQLAAGLLSLKPEEVAIASTGIIGRQLPMDKIGSGLRAMLVSPHQREGEVAARAIMTTDTRMKQVYCRRVISGEEISVAGIAKGSGMIAPNMATMLAFLVTDAAVRSPLLQQQLSEAVEQSFNMVSVDTDTSTNDMVLAIAAGPNRLSGSEGDKQFAALLCEACVLLAKQIAADGEGATKLIEARVSGARTIDDARRHARNIISSPLVKAAVHGADPNWGRVLMALGKDPQAGVDPDSVDLYFGREQILSKGEIVDYKVDVVREELCGTEVLIRVDLNQGDAAAAAWGCDLTKEYVEINTAYN